jgi:hypothetical protein
MRPDAISFNDFNLYPWWSHIFLLPRLPVRKFFPAVKIQQEPVQIIQQHVPPGFLGIHKAVSQCEGPTVQFFFMF